MGFYYTGGHTAGNHIYTDITRYNTEEPKQKYRHGTVVKSLRQFLSGKTDSHLNIDMAYCVEH